MKKKDIKTKIIELILKGKTTAEIARIMGYSIGTIRNFYTELREDYDVDSKTGIALCYVTDRMADIRNELDELISILPKKSNDT